MPFPFVLPTTSPFSFSSCFNCDSHPSLPLNASTYRGVVRDALKKHKRLPPTSQASDLPNIVSSLNRYLAYLFAVDAGLAGRSVSDEEINVVLKSTPTLEWRPTLSEKAIPGRDTTRVKIQSLEYEVSFALSTLAYTSSLLARACLRPLHATSGTPLGTQERGTAILTASKHLMEAASVHDYLARRAEGLGTLPPCPDISQPTTRAMALLAQAEVNLLAVLKEDPYPAVVAQNRNQDDKEWMFKAPEIRKPRVNLSARLCLAAADHAAQASSLCQSTGKGMSRLDDGLLRYLEDLRRTSRAKACRFFAIDADMVGKMGDAIGWLRCGLQELGIESQFQDAKKGPSLSRMKKDWNERREDKKIQRETNWGADAGRFEETRIIEMLDAKWTKENDTMLAQVVPPVSTLLSGLPSGRDMSSISPYSPPELDRYTLEAMRAPPERPDNYDGDQLSSDDEDKQQQASAPVGAFPGTQDDYRAESTRSYY